MRHNTIKRVIVTGGSRGIGKAIAAILLKQGYEVIIVARGDKELVRTAMELKQYGRISHAVGQARS